MIKKVIILYHESLMQSVLKDIFTFGIMVGSFTVNHFFIGSTFLSGVLLAMFILYVLGKCNARHEFTDKQKAIDFINKTEG